MGKRTPLGMYYTPTRNEVDVIGKGLRRMYAPAASDGFEELLRQIDDADIDLRAQQLQNRRTARIG